MTGPLFVFDETWRLPAAREVVVATLADVDGYPRWWPQVRTARRITDDTGRAEIRSVLPISLRLAITSEVEDHGAGLLRVRLAGDLVGWSQWRVTSEAHGATARFTQEARVAQPLLRRAVRAPFVPAVLRLNHTAMMRAGERGLRELLSRT